MASATRLRPAATYSPARRAPCRGLLRTVLALTMLTRVQAQFGSTCDGKNVPDVAALANQYPPLWTVANIVKGDTAAQTAFNNIQGAALSFSPSVMVNGNPTVNGYTDSDPRCWWSWSNCVDSKVTGIPMDGYTCREPMTWGLSFDDGPTCAHAPLYSLLKQNNQQATMFFIGSNVANYPIEARLAYDNGHTICVHTWSHHFSTSLTNEQIFAELWYTKRIIKDVLGITPRCWRPPYGDVDDRIRTIANALELWTVIWDNDTNDWEASESGPAQPNADYAQILAGNYHNHGTMVLTHEVDAPAVSLFLQHWTVINQKFNHVASVHTCMNITAPYAEANAPTYQNFAQLLAGPNLQTLNAPVRAGTSGAIVFSGQAAFQASLNGIDLSPSLSSSSAAPSSTMSSSTIVVAPSTSQVHSSTTSTSPSASATLAVADTSHSKSETPVGTIAGAIAAGVSAAILVALTTYYIRRRGWLCYAKRPRTKHEVYGVEKSPSLGGKGNFGPYHSEHALLDPALSRSNVSLVGFDSFENHSRYPSQSDLRPLSQGHQYGIALGGDESPPPASPTSSASSLSRSASPQPLTRDTATDVASRTRRTMAAPSFEASLGVEPLAIVGSRHRVVTPPTQAVQPDRSNFWDTQRRAPSGYEIIDQR